VYNVGKHDGQEMNVVSPKTKTVIERAKQIYADRLRSVLEPEHADLFVAIEPESGDYFLGDTLDEAVKLARTKQPSRLTHTIRIGHRVALHLGGLRSL
jgi:hypothetical protein